MHTGETVLDCFSGIGTTSIIGAWRGCQVIGCELEKKFHDLALENVELHRRGWETMHRPIPVLLNGDSRKLRDVIRDAVESYGQLGSMKEGSISAIVSSPTFLNARSGTTASETSSTGPCEDRSQSVADGNRLGQSDGQLADMKEGSISAMVSSPPYVAPPGHDSGHPRLDAIEDLRRATDGSARRSGYGSAEGNIAHLQEGSIDSVITSPPYEEIAAGAGGLNTLPPKPGQQGGRSPESASQQADQRYGESAGQLARMGKGDVANVMITSPPFLGAHGGVATDDEPRQRMEDGRLPKTGMMTQTNYGETLGQLGSMKSDDTFWSASDAILRECFALLKPNAHAAFIVKSFVRSGKIVNFPADWRRLCEHIGFETLTEIHAMQVQKETHTNLFAEEVTTKKEKKGFFRRIHEARHPETAINFEVVYIMRKP